jgi:hypothetical protein
MEKSSRTPPPACVWSERGGGGSYSHVEKVKNHGHGSSATSSSSSLSGLVWLSLIPLLSFLSVSTPISPHEQWLAGWVVLET